jgi:hypothetical protein
MNCNDAQPKLEPGFRWNGFRVVGTAPELLDAWDALDALTHLDSQHPDSDKSDARLRHSEVIQAYLRRAEALENELRSRPTSAPHKADLPSG